VVDAKNVFFPEDGVYHPVQSLRCREVLSERFLNYDARALSASRLAKLMNDNLEKARRNCQIVQRVFCIAELAA